MVVCFLGIGSNLGNRRKNIKALQNRTGARILLIVHYKKLEGRKPTVTKMMMRAR